MAMEVISAQKRSVLQNSLTELSAMLTTSGDILNFVWDIYKNSALSEIVSHLKALIWS